MAVGRWVTILLSQYLTPICSIKSIYSMNLSVGNIKTNAVPGWSGAALVFIGTPETIGP